MPFSHFALQYSREPHGDGFFRQRRDNSNEYVLGIEGGGSVCAQRRPGAEVTVHKVKTISVDNLTASQLAAILAAG